MKLNDARRANDSAKNDYCTDTELECKNIILFVYGITRSNQFYFCKPDKNEYKNKTRLQIT